MAVEEMWKPIPGYEGYEVSDQGRVRSLDRWVRYPKGHSVWYQGKLLKPGPIGKGYRGVILPPQQMRSVHQLVMLAFVGECPIGQETCHDNNRRADNRLSNLRYGTPKENQADRVAHGTTCRGIRAPWTKFSAEAVRDMRESGLEPRELMDKYGVSSSHLWGIQHGTQRRWD